jgi:predicted O-linked N-acetylglucosamine transferase (SPINDLY family)
MAQSGQPVIPIPQAIQLALDHCQAGRFPEAERIFQQVLAIEPDNPYALHFLGLIAHQAGKNQIAVELISRALTSWPAYAEAFGNLGNILQELGRFEEALASYGKAIAIKAELSQELLWNRVHALKELKRFEEVLATCDEALAIKPDFAEALCIRGNALQELKRFGEALPSYDKALALSPDYAEALRNRGNALLELQRFDEALASLDRALTIQPDFAAALYNRGNALQELKRYDQALADYGRALSINPKFDYLLGACLHMKLQICDWADLTKQVDELVRRIEHGERAAQAFPALALTGSLRAQRKAAEIWVNDKFPPNPSLPSLSKRARHGKIRIGYYSADFRDHPVAYLIAGLFEQHDRDKFELFAFSFGPDRNDDMRKRIYAAFDKSIDVRGRSDGDAALLSRSLEIDIAIDLNGFTADNRAGIFSRRAAPLQVSYLGYPGTMGAEYMDYLIADRTLIPDTCRQYYSEKIAYLPNSYQANDAKRAIAPVTLSRPDLGLPDTGFIFCCFNNSYKITPAVFDRWMRILKQVSGSVLWLLQSSATATGNLRKEAEARGVDPARLIFADRMPLPEHLARQRAADLFIDTLPYNAHTTASDALWAGLPVLTCMEEAFASRVAASLLNAVHLPELITTTPEKYEALAIELATNQDRLARIRRKLEANRLTTPLFDTRLFTRHIENAYTQMYERHHAGLPPEHLYVNS